MVHFLADLDGIQCEEEIALAMVTASLDDIMKHFLPCRKSWVRHGRTWCMLKQGREQISRTYHQRWQEQEIIDLEGTRAASGVSEVALEEGEVEDRGWVGWGVKLGPRRYIDVDGANQQLISIWTEPSGPLAYDPGLELHHPTMSKFWGHGGRLEREIERERENGYQIYSFKEKLTARRIFGTLRLGTDFYLIIIWVNIVE